MQTRRLSLLLVVAAAVTAKAETYLNEAFENEEPLSAWTLSKAAKGDAEYDGVWEVRQIVPPTDKTDGNSALVLTEANHHYAISAPLKKPFQFSDKPLVVQYSVRYEQKMACGGSYMKLLSNSEDLSLDQVKDDTLYTILFGPDKCGDDAHLRFIFNFKNPTTGIYREVHATKISSANTLIFSDHHTHLVTLVLKPDNTFSIAVDEKPVLSGRLGSEDEFDPALNPPRQIDDPEDTKPEDWIDEKEMDDPDDIRPEDWVTEAELADPTAEMPEGWDEEMDGEWEPPMIRNPDFKGEFIPRKIENPDYKGIWKPKQLDNPEYFKENDPFHKLNEIAAVAYELWTITAGVAFDDIIITDSEDEASAAAERWRVQSEVELAESGTVVFDTLKSFYDAAQSQPLLWLVYAAALLIPVYFLFCAGSSEIVESSNDVDDEGDDEDDEADEDEGEGEEEIEEEENKSEVEQTDKKD